jgi:hypothetical protein
MLKFFRHFRYKFLKKNKLTRYLIYAIGEIILIVIGILIALEINNKNELRKNEDFSRLALLEIQKNLIESIEFSQQELEDYLNSISTENKIFDFENPWTYEDYQLGKVKILGNHYYDYKINKYGYENFIRHLDKLPPKYSPILYDLKPLYVDIIENVEVSNERIRNTVYSNLDFLYNQNWGVYRKKSSIISREEMDYYLHDDVYKKKVLRFMNDRYNVFKNSQRFRLKAISAYLKIDSLLNKNSSQLYREQLGQLKDPCEFELYKGKYICVDNSIPYTFDLFVKDNYLYSRTNLGEKIKSYKVNDSLFIALPENNHPIITQTFTNKEGSIVIKFLNRSLPNFIKMK